MWATSGRTAFPSCAQTLLTQVTVSKAASASSKRFASMRILFVWVSAIEGVQVHFILIYIQAVHLHNTRDPVSLQQWSYYIWEQLLNKACDLRPDVQKNGSAQVLQDISEALPHMRDFSFLFHQKSSEMKLWSFSKCWFRTCELLNTWAEPAHSCPKQGTVSEQDSHLGHLAQDFPFLTVVIKSQALTLATFRAGEMLDLGLGSFVFLDKGWEELSSFLSFHYEMRWHPDNSLLWVTHAK